MTLVEVLLGLAITAALMVAVGYAFSGVASAYKTTQATLAGVNSARVAMDYLISQIRVADGCTDAGTATASGDATYPFATDELSINFGGGAARSDCDSTDMLELHLKVIDQGAGKKGLRIWKDTPGSARWNGRTYEPGDAFDLPGVTTAKIWYSGTTADVRSVQLELTVETAGPNGQMLKTNLVGTATVRR